MLRARPAALPVGVAGAGGFVAGNAGLLIAALSAGQAALAIAASLALVGLALWLGPRSEGGDEGVRKLDRRSN